VDLSADQTVTAVFNEIAPPCSNPIKVTRQENAYYYSTIQSAYANASDGDALKIRSMDFTENLLLNRSIAVTLDGGYDCDFEAVGGSTTLKGTLTITSGTLTVNNLIIGPVD